MMNKLTDDVQTLTVQRNRFANPDSSGLRKKVEYLVKEWSCLDITKPHNLK